MSPAQRLLGALARFRRAAMRPGRRTRALPWRTVFAFLLALGLAAALPAQAAHERPNLERDVKAAFLYKFVAYVSWPEGSFVRSDAPLVFGVVGDDATIHALSEVVAGRHADGRSMQVRRLRENDTLAGVHVLFVDGSESVRLPALLRTVPPQQPLLVVTEWPGALEQGSMINFVVSDGRVKFNIAPEAADRRGVKLSSRLLTVAQNVRTPASP